MDAELDNLKAFVEFNKTPRHYKIILLTPPDLIGTENAQAVLGLALDPLNQHVFRRGYRFPDNMEAKLETEHNLETVKERIGKENDVALVIACGYEKSQLETFAYLCESKKVEFCNARQVALDERKTTEQMAEDLGNDPSLLSISQRRNLLPGHEIDERHLLDAQSISPEVEEGRVGNFIKLLALTMSRADMARSPLRE